MFVLDKIIFNALWGFLNIEGMPIGLFLVLGAIAGIIPSKKKVK